MIAIIDYDAGNIKSVEKALLSLGQEVTVTAKQDEILGADKIVLPGVGAFGDAMENLRKRQLDAVIREAVEKEIPFLGICLGLQVLFEQSEEAPGVEGLGILKGKICRIPNAEGLKIPHMGWNSLHLENNGRLFKGIEDDPYILSYILIPPSFLLLHSFLHFLLLQKGHTIYRPLTAGMPYALLRNYP